jgi:DNA-binding transcriptional ArsR family regulator
MVEAEVPLLDKSEELVKAAKVFRAINHPVRKQIFKILHAKSQATVTEIYAKLRIEQSAASQHLKLLREVNMVETERKGRLIFYKPNYEKLALLEKVVSKIVSEIVSV